MHHLVHTTGEPIQEWANRTNPDVDGERWHAWDQIVFVRDRLHPVFVPEHADRTADPVRVIGTHTSKSVTLPVFSIYGLGLELTLRYNFYDWKVSVEAVDYMAKVPDNWPKGLFDRSKAHNAVYFEGFKDEWVFGSYDDRRNKVPEKLGETFSVELYDRYDLFLFCSMLAEGQRREEG